MAKVMQAVVGTDMRTRGFTLIELLVTIAVAVILATVAVPSFQSMMVRSQWASDYNEVLSGLYFARSEAIKRRVDVSFEVMADSPWEYRVYVTDGGNENPIRIRQVSGDQVKVTDDDIVKFNSLGKIVEGSDCEENCSLIVSHDNGDSKNISISGFGRIGRGGS